MELYRIGWIAARFFQDGNFEYSVVDVGGGGVAIKFTARMRLLRTIALDSTNVLRFLRNSTYIH